MAWFYHRPAFASAEATSYTRRPMVGYGLKLGAAAIAILFAGVIAIILFGNIWARIGIGAAILIVGGGLLLFAWSVDRKDRARREGVEDLPRI
jgi:hypothetical protein